MATPDPPTAPLAVTRGRDHVLEHVDREAAELLGLHGGTGRPLREVLGDGELLDLLDRCLAGAAPQQATVSGSAGGVRVVGVPTRAPDGTVTGVVVRIAAAPAVEASSPEAARNRSAALLLLAEALSSAATPAAIGELAVTRAATLLGADAATAFVTHPAGLEQVHSVGWPGELTERYRILPLQRGRPLSDAVLGGIPVWLEDAGQWRARYPEMAPVHEAGGYEGSACLPLRVDERDLGALVFSFRRPRAFDADERDYLLAVAALCAQALDRARLYVAERDARAAAETERDRMAFLAEVGLVLDAPMSVRERLRRVADLAVPGIADWCAVTLLDGERVEQVAVAHRDPEKVAFARRLQEAYPPDPELPGGSVHVARTGVPTFLPEIDDALLVAAARDGAHLELIRTLGMRSAMTLPLRPAGAAWARSRWSTPSRGAGSPTPTWRWASSSRVARRSRSTTCGSTRTSAASRARCRQPCSRTSCRWSRACSSRRGTCRRGRTPRWAAISTTCSPTRRATAGTSSSRTCAARAWRPPRSRR